ncbi:MAG: UbiD family decarboxylase [Planctomycetaceae bacterium]
MGYKNLRDCVNDLQRQGELLRIEPEVDPYLEAGEIQRRVYAAGGPALYFANVKDCRFPMVSNLFGTIERTRYIFRDAIEGVKKLIGLKLDPSSILKDPWGHRKIVGPGVSSRIRSVRSGPILHSTTTIDQLPNLVSWPDDGGPFVTLPQVYSEHPKMPGFGKSNLGMYRVQLSGNEYETNKEIGLHYQIHRSIGQHHAAAIEAGMPLRVNIFVGGPPSMALAAVMPLPDGIPELSFAGAIGRRAIRMIRNGQQLPVPADADFCICGYIDGTKPEGPFGDHLGYYSLVHDFPMLKVEKVYHRKDAIWPFTTVGRPPQEDTSFGEIIHELTGPAIPAVIPGVHAVHAVDAAGVHPLLLAIGSERYVPYAKQRRPQELLTNANAILGQGQLSLAKYLLIAAKEDDPQLDIHHIDEFFSHMLRRVDWRTDLHFQTCTTIDTLDYSGTGLNAGSKLVIAAAGAPRRELVTEMPERMWLPSGFESARLAQPGIAVVAGPKYRDRASATREMQTFCSSFRQSDPLSQFPLVIVADDADFTARTLNNFLWTTFTRSNPASDIYGIESFTHEKHWGCRGSLVIDARIKPHHAPPLIEDPVITKRVDALGASGGPLHGVI